MIRAWVRYGFGWFGAGQAVLGEEGFLLWFLGGIVVLAMDVSGTLFD